VLAVLLPVKEFARSKQRLAAWLGPAERQRLARAMFEDVWATLRAAKVFDRILVVTSEPVVIAVSREESVPCLIETAPRSHSGSVSEATRWAMSLGATSLVSVPIDTPAVTKEELSALADLGRQYSVVIVPSADGTGTNALLRTPPDAIAPRFGPDSCRLHAEQSRAEGLRCIVAPVAGLAADVDTPDDTERFLALHRPGRTATLLRELLQAQPYIHQGTTVCS
jgi:2-phospho-L-lactate guanylyltransferase